MVDGRILLSEQETTAALAAMAEHIRKQVHKPVLVAIETGGTEVTKTLQEYLQCPAGQLNISFYRDDFQRIGLHPRVTPTKLPLDIEGRNIVLVDDVIYTGRTVRAALNEVFDYGRPSSVTLATVVDRNGRELPIQPDFTCIKVEVLEHEHVQLNKLPLSFSVISTK